MAAYGRQVGFEYAHNKPKWQQIADVIISRIKDGTYGVDERIPSEHEMVAEFDPVARGTVRKVLEHLRDEGWTYVVRGMGSYVSPNPPVGQS